MSQTNVYITEDKAKRIAVGATVGGVLLILFLAIVLIIQFVQIGVKTSDKKRLEEQIAQYERQIELGEKDLSFYHTQEGLYFLARKDGWQ